MRSSRALPLAALALLVASATTHAAPVVVVKSSGIPPFEQATAALVEALEAAKPPVDSVTLDLGGDPTHGADVLRAIAAADPRVVVPVGSLATSIVLQDRSPVPVVFSMVLYPAQSGFVSTPARAVTGAALDMPLDLQFRELRKILPAARRVGVLYHASETGTIVEAARASLARQGLALDAREVTNPGAALDALTDLMERVDVVWSVADSAVFTPQTTSALILAALRRGVPLIGLSAAHVRSGALAALSCDYADVGRQTAALALRVLHGEDAASIPSTAPRSLTLSLNLRTAEHLGLVVPPAVTADAAEVVR